MEASKKSSNKYFLFKILMVETRKNVGEKIQLNELQ